MDAAEWEATAGQRCPQCGEEVWQLVDGNCLACYNRHQADIARGLGRKAEKRALGRTDFFRGRSVSIGGDEGDLLDRCLNEGLD